MHYIQRILSKINSKFLNRNHGGSGTTYFKALKGKNCQPRILYLAKLYLKHEGEIETFPKKQKMREFIARRPALQEMLKGVLPVEMKSH